MAQDTDTSKTTQIIQTLTNQGLLMDAQQVEISKLTGGYHNYVYHLRKNNDIDWVIKQYLNANKLSEAEALAGELDAFETAWSWLQENLKQHEYQILGNQVQVT
jgi:hypothetical protein